MQTLKLDASYRPIEVIDSLEALIMCLLGKAIAVENYSKKINTTSLSFDLPAVIVLKKVVKFISNHLSPNRSNIIWRDKYICQYCGEKFPFSKLTIDHIIPKSRGGKNTWGNLVAACSCCNQSKGNKTPEEAGMSLIKKPLEPKNNVLRNSSEIRKEWEDYLW